MAGNSWRATLVACHNRVEGPRRQEAAKQHGGIGWDRDVIASLGAPALDRAGKLDRDRLRPKLEGLGPALFETRDPCAVDLAMGRTFEVDIAAIGSSACSAKREAIGPGSINTTCMPVLLSSRRSASARASIANFEAQ
jgi:hypothetical protein